MSQPRPKLAQLCALLLVGLVQPDAIGREVDSTKLCNFALGMWQLPGNRFLPVLLQKPELDRQDRYWRGTAQGLSIPVPRTDGAWETYSVENGAGLWNDELGLEVYIAQSVHLDGLSGIASIIERNGLPKSKLSPIEVVRLAATIDPNAVTCSSPDIDTTVNETSAFYLKSQLLAGKRAVYLHDGGVLGFAGGDLSESWTYIFEGNEPGSLFELSIGHNQPGQYDGLGFEITDRALSTSREMPDVIHQFFEAIDNENYEAFEKLELEP